jgi:hypothetical protein
MAQEQDRIAGRTADPNAAVYPQGTPSDTIRKDIEGTRAEMDHTVDALGERLRPRHLLDDLLEMFRGSSVSASAGGTTETIKQAGGKVLDRLKDNPMPAALIGAGVAWLLFSDEDKTRRSKAHQRFQSTEPPMYSGSYVDARTGKPYDASYGEKYRSGAAAAGAAQQTGQSTVPGQEQPGMAQKAKEKLSAAAETTREAMAGWTGSARESASGMGQGMREYSSAAGEQMHRGYDAGMHYVERGIEEYPLAMGAAAMALGVLAGLVMPATRAEDKWMGEAADDVKDRAKEAGRSIASATAGAASEEAQRQGGQPGELGEKVKRVAQDVAQVVSDSARREGIDPQSLKDKARTVGERAKEAAQEESQRQRDA